MDDPIKLISIPENRRISDKTGVIFGRLTVIGLAEIRVRLSGNEDPFWACRCDCGNTTVVSASNLATGASKSCGCLSKEISGERFKTHGMSDYPEYTIWKSMISRIENMRNKQYKDYGGRGIKIHPEWRASFAIFIRDMGRKPSLSHSIERKNNDGDYEPDNCIWIEFKKQSRNKRTTRLITHNGETRSLAEWGEVFNVRYELIRKRLNRGWTFLDAVSFPLRTTSLTKSGLAP